MKGRPIITDQTGCIKTKKRKHRGQSVDPSSTFNPDCFGTDSTIYRQFVDTASAICRSPLEPQSNSSRTRLEQDSNQSRRSLEQQSKRSRTAVEQLPNKCYKKVIWNDRFRLNEEIISDYLSSWIAQKKVSQRSCWNTFFKVFINYISRQIRPLFLPSSNCCNKSSL